MSPAFKQVVQVGLLGNCSPAKDHPKPSTTVRINMNIHFPLCISSSILSLRFALTLVRASGISGVFEITKSQHTRAAQSPERLALRSSDKIAPLRNHIF